MISSIIAARFDVSGALTIGLLRSTVVAAASSAPIVCVPVSHIVAASAHRATRASVRLLADTSRDAHRTFCE